MKKILYALTLVGLAAALAGCTTGNEYDAKFDTPDGIYITGDATLFSTEASYGMLQPMQDPRLNSLMTWLSPQGSFRISLVGPDHTPVVYGMGEPVDRGNGLPTYTLSRNGQGFTVTGEGLYQVIVNSSLGELTIIPVTMRILSDKELTVDGAHEVLFDAPSYDRTNHLVTWHSSQDPMRILAAEYRFSYSEQGSLNVPLADGEEYTVTTSYTGLEASSKTNLLTTEWQPLTGSSDVALSLKRQGDYVIELQYDVRQTLFTARIEGEEYIEPEAQGYPERLYMTDGDWSSAVEMTPCGAAGNGVFWTLASVSTDKGLRWSTSGTDADAFASLTENHGFQVVDAEAVPDESGARLIFVDLHKGVLALEVPELYGMGECFAGLDVAFTQEGDRFTVTTQTDGNLRMYAVCPWNTREWDSMEFGILGNRIVYRGVGDELPAVPVAAGVPVEVDFATGEAMLQVPLTPAADVPASGPIYMIASGYGNMNWGSSEDVIGLNRIWSDKSMWLAVRYFEAGTRIRFSTEGSMFGKGEFVSLDNNFGFTEESGYAVIEQAGTYAVYVNLGKRIVAIQPATIYTYGTASSSTSDANVNSPFVASADGKTLTYTVENEGSLRFHPDIEAFGSDVSRWKREYYVDLTTLDIRQRLEGDDEPNKDYVWKPGTVIELNFKTMKATITE